MIIRTGLTPLNIQQNTHEKIDSNLSTHKKTDTSTISSNSEIIDNSQKTQDIKEQIENGNYEINNQKTADKMAQDLLLES